MVQTTASRTCVKCRNTCVLGEKQPKMFKNKAWGLVCWFFFFLFQALPRNTGKENFGEKFKRNVYYVFLSQSRQ